MSAKIEPFLGRYDIVHMNEWDEEACNLMGQAFIELRPGKTGAFQFCAVTGELDCRFAQRGGEPTVEFSWEGDSEGEPCCGRGWAVLDGDELAGHLFIHFGDDSAFRARKTR